MALSLWSGIQHKKQVVSMDFAKGINSDNDPLDLKNDELLDAQNMCSDDFPIIRTRNDRLITALPQSSGLYGMGQRANTELHILTSNTWAYASPDSTAWTNISTAIPSPNVPKFVDFNTQTAKYTIMAYSTGDVYNSYWDGSLYSTFSDTNCPRSNLFTAHRYRLYGVDKDGRTLKYSALGDFTDYTTVDDAGYIDITNAKGGIVAITTFADHVILWTENSMHELYGSAVDNYELVDVGHSIGCVNRFAYTQADGKLFWMDYSGIYMYIGGLPRKVADKIDGILDGINMSYRHLIRAGSIDNKIYFAVPYKSTENNLLIVIDIINDSKRSVYTIHKEDGNWNSMVINNDRLYGLRSDGYIFDLHSTYKTGLDNSTAIDWYMETRPITDEIDMESAVRDIWLRHSGTTDATMSFGYTTQDNSTTFTEMAASSDFVHTDWLIDKEILPTSTQLQGMKFMKFRISGTGHKKIAVAKFNIISYQDR